MATTTLTDPGAELRRIREQLGLSQSEVARRCGMTQQAHISQIEGGERRLTYRMAVRFEVGLNLEEDLLARLTDDHPANLRAAFRGSAIADFFVCRLARSVPSPALRLAAA